MAKAKSKTPPDSVNQGKNESGKPDSLQNDASSDASRKGGSQPSTPEDSPPPECSDSEIAGGGQPPKTGKPVTGGNPEGDGDGEFSLEEFAEATPDPLEPEDLSAYALEEDPDEEVVDELLTAIPIRKSSKESFFRTSPNPAHGWQKFGLIEIGMEEYYLLSPAIERILRNEGEACIRRARLILSVTNKGMPFLYLDKEAVKDNDSWSKSRRRAAEVAKEKWIRVNANKKGGQYYDILVAKNQEAMGEPRFPDMEFKEILKLAFEDRIINSLDHPVLKGLGGEA